MVHASLGPQARQWEVGSFNLASACSCPTCTGSIQTDIQGGASPDLPAEGSEPPSNSRRAESVNPGWSPLGM